MGNSFWQTSEANYFGHNAIIRVAAFAECCRLPVLPGKPPLGGEILSHDFVEAAFLRRGGWHCWLLPELHGSYEELPTNLLDYAVRDRRWMQGNLQHARLIGAARAARDEPPAPCNGHLRLPGLAAVACHADAELSHGGRPSASPETSSSGRRARCSRCGRNTIGPRSTACSA